MSCETWGRTGMGQVLTFELGNIIQVNMVHRNNCKNDDSPRPPLHILQRKSSEGILQSRHIVQYLQNGLPVVHNQKYQEQECHPFLILEELHFPQQLVHHFSPFCCCVLYCYYCSYRCFLEAAAESAHLKTDDSCSSAHLLLDSVTRTSKQTPHYPVSKDNTVKSIIFFSHWMAIFFCFAQISSKLLAFLWYILQNYTSSIHLALLTYEFLAVGMLLFCLIWGVLKTFISATMYIPHYEGKIKKGIHVCYIMLIDSQDGSACVLSVLVPMSCSSVAGCSCNQYLADVPGYNRHQICDR